MIYDHQDETPASDRFADALALCQIALNAKTVQANVKKLARLEKDIATASETLARLQSQAAQVLERANAEAARIRKAAEEETRDQRADLEAREAQFQYGERYRAKIEAAKARSPHGVLTSLDERLAREELCAEDNSDGGAVTFRQFEERDADYQSAAANGQLNVETVAGSKLTRSYPNKAAREATR